MSQLRIKDRRVLYKLSVNGLRIIRDNRINEDSYNKFLGGYNGKKLYSSKEAYKRLQEFYSTPAKITKNAKSLNIGLKIGNKLRSLRKFSEDDIYMLELKAICSKEGLKAIYCGSEIDVSLEEVLEKLENKKLTIDLDSINRIKTYQSDIRTKKVTKNYNQFRNHISLYKRIREREIKNYTQINNTEDYYTLSEIALILDVNSHTALKFISSSKIKYKNIKNGKNNFYLISKKQFYEQIDRGSFYYTSNYALKITNHKSINTLDDIARFGNFGIKLNENKFSRYRFSLEDINNLKEAKIIYNPETKQREIIL